MIIHIKHNGDIGKVCMPDMNPKVAESVGYHKMLQVLEILKPGTREEFIKYHENKRKIHFVTTRSPFSNIFSGDRQRARAIIKHLNKDIIECILEIDGSQKIDHFLPGTDIPIHNEKKLYKDQPEYAFIFSWHISKEIISNLKSRGYKGKFIIPLPTPRIIS